MKTVLAHLHVQGFPVDIVQSEEGDIYPDCEHPAFDWQPTAEEII
jgi:hypothetical protein